MVLTALSDDSEAVVFEVSKAVGPALYKFHLPMESFSDSIASGEAPHADDLLRPRLQSVAERRHGF